MEQRPGDPNQPYDEQPDPATRTRGIGQQEQPAGPKKRLFAPKGCGCLGGAALLVIIAVAIAESAGGSNPAGTSTTQASAGSSYSSVPIYPMPTDPSPSLNPDVNIVGLGATTAAAVPEKVTYHCTGHAPDGVDITYGPEGSSFSASHLSFTKTATLNDSAQYYAIQAQLSGAGSVTCTLTVQTSDGTVVTQSGSASGGYNIASAEICSSFDGSWEKC